MIVLKSIGLPRSVCSLMLRSTIFCAVFFMLFSTLKPNNEKTLKVRPVSGNMKILQTIKPLKLVKSTGNPWLDEVLSSIWSRGHQEILPLIEKLDRSYNDSDEELYKIIREKYLIRPPSEENGAYWNLKNSGETSMGQAQKVIEIFKHRLPWIRKGFFIECGALDGEQRSNTLTLERDYGWRGVLIEADPDNLMNTLDKRRRSWVVPACLSTSRSTQQVRFRAWGNVGTIDDGKKFPSDNREKQNMTRVLNVTCLPFYSIVKALDRNDIDYLSLDVEGNELDILKTIPFEKVNIKVISAEFIHTNENGDSKIALRNFMESKGYVVHSEVIQPQNLANDFIFVKNSFRSK